ncbi:hypothetical protein KAR34_04050 [bacterium]|nr:hypothetical protein [bacterium]
MKNIDLLLNNINGEYYKYFISKRNKITSEEELRVAFSSLINSISSKYKINIAEEHHEYTILKGRVDSLYGASTFSGKDHQGIR